MWIVAGVLFKPLALAIIPITLLLLRGKKQYHYMLLGLFVILTLSDSRQNFLGFAASIKDIYILFLFIFLITDRQSFSPMEKIVNRFIPYIILATFFVVFSDIIVTSLQKTLSYVLLLIVVPNYVIYTWRTLGFHAIRSFIFTAVLLLLVGFVFRVLSPGIVTLAGRYSGILGNPNGLGLFCTLLFIVFTVARDIFPDLFSNKEKYVVWGAILISLYLSGSRSAIFTIGLFIIIGYFYKITPFLGVLVFLVMVLVYQLILVNIESVIVFFNLQEYFRLETFQNASGRLIAWDFAWDQITENPLLGKGVGHTEYVFRKNYDFLAALGHQGNAHNSFLTFWIDTGLFGVLSYLFAFISFFVTGARRSRLAIPAMLAILFSAFFESWLTASLNPFTIQLVVLITILISPAFSEEHIEAMEEESEEEGEFDEESETESPYTEPI